MERGGGVKDSNEVSAGYKNVNVSANFELLPPEDGTLLDEIALDISCTHLEGSKDLVSCQSVT